MVGDVLITTAFVTALVCITFSGYAAMQNNRGGWEAIMHGLFLGPFGPLLIALYPRGTARPKRMPPEHFMSLSEERQRDAEIVKLLSRIHAELRWQREEWSRK